jgi:hypothetical protein
VIGPPDLLHAKLRAAADPAGRKSKRMQDLADVQALLETRPALATALPSEEEALLARIGSP